MKAMLQRVDQAQVTVDGKVVGDIDLGLLVFLGIEKGDTETTADKLLHRLLHYRVFADDKGRMNRNVQQAEGGVLLVSQFTLAADTRSGLRPSFTPAAAPDDARALYDYCLRTLQSQHSPVAAGEFAADMRVSLTNNGPVTFLLEVNPE